MADVEPPTHFIPFRIAVIMIVTISLFATAIHLACDIKCMRGL